MSGDKTLRTRSAAIIARPARLPHQLADFIDADTRAIKGILCTFNGTNTGNIYLTNVRLTNESQQTNRVNDMIQANVTSRLQWGKEIS